MVKYPKIKKLRENKDKTQIQVANDLDMWLTTYQNYEVGRRVPPFDFMVKLARYYNVSLDYLAGFIDTPKELNLKKDNK